MSELPERFWAKVRKSDRCWIFTGTLAGFGHGHFWTGRRMERAHRISWLLSNGPIPEKMCVCHRCDVPACVRPDHLFLASKADNARDMYKKHRDSQSRKEQCKNGHPFNAENTYRRGQWRMCRACTRERMRRLRTHAPDCRLAKALGRP